MNEPQTSFPLAYHITFWTYGTRLHGDARGTVSREETRFGYPIVMRDDTRKRFEAGALLYSRVVFTLKQRLVVEQAVPAICERGGWKYHIAACQPDHVHLLSSAEADGKEVRKWLKRWLSAELQQQWKRDNAKSWWAEGGSVKWIWDKGYFEAVFAYIQKQRATKE